MDRIEKLRQFLQANPDDSFVQHALAMEYIKTGDESGAEQMLTALLQKDPGYVGSYYHLAKLFERKGDTGSAIKYYEQGMEQATAAGDRHGYGELRAALEELTF